jgi:hypothetical protein
MVCKRAHIGDRTFSYNCIINQPILIRYFLTFDQFFLKRAKEYFFSDSYAKYFPLYTQWIEIKTCIQGVSNYSIFCLKKIINLGTRHQKFCLGIFQKAP